MWEKKKYKTKYSDDSGEFDTYIWNNGKELSVEIRGVTFSGQDFDGLEPTGNPSSKMLQKFTLYSNMDLCNCRFLCDIPIDMRDDQTTISTILHMDLKLGKPRPRPHSGIDQEDLILKLKYNDRLIQSSGTSGWFEEEMLDIQKSLPPKSFLLCCFNCAFSDYHPVGHGLFGSLMCFRENKEAYLSIKSKDDFFEIEDTASSLVQETFICSEFQRRVPGTGYRG